MPASMRLTGSKILGTRYIIEGAVEVPDGRNLKIRTVWFLESGAGTPRFVTAYPLKEERS